MTDSAGNPFGDAEPEEIIEQLPWREVESSNVARIAFCRTEQLPTRVADGGTIDLGWLWVQFRSGKIYAYERVPAASFVAVEIATSPTKMFNALVKGRYACAGYDPSTGRSFMPREHR